MTLTFASLELTPGRQAELAAMLEGYRLQAAAAGMGLYLALDGVWAPELTDIIRKTCRHWEPLNQEPGQPRDDAHPLSPILVDLVAYPGIAQSWVTQCFTARIGAVYASRLPMPDIRRSLRRFGLVLAGNDPTPAMFRYWDAQVVDCFLASASALQRQDFLRDLDTLLLPGMPVAHWQLYRMDGLALLGATDQGDWQPVPAPDVQIDPAAYEVTFPFRQIPSAQLEQMNKCSARAFVLEAARLIAAAFPAECATITLADLEDHITQSLKIAEQHGAVEESAQMLWVVLSFMGGLSFYERPPVSKVLSVRWIDLETRLEDLVFQAGAALDNPILMDLADTLEVWEQKNGGKAVGQLYRSGRRLPDR